MGSCLAVPSSTRRAPTPGKTSGYYTDSFYTCKPSLQTQHIRLSRNPIPTKKILILGSLESGKSTLFKQLKVLFGPSFCDEDRLSYRSLIYQNILESTRSILETMQRQGVDLYRSEVRRAASVIMGLQWEQIIIISDSTFFKCANDLQIIWDDPDFLAAVRQLSNFDYVEYFGSQLERIKQTDYIPSIKDIIYARCRTTGISELEAEIDGIQCSFWDVGGARNERKKWIHCVKNVDMVLFLVNSAQLDQSMFEDAQQNRMMDSLQLFADISTSSWFQQVPMVLVFNRVDSLEYKMKMQPNKNFLQAFTPEDRHDKPVQEMEDICRFVKKRFATAAHEQARKIDCYFTSLADSESVRQLLKKVWYDYFNWVPPALADSKKLMHRCLDVAKRLDSEQVVFIPTIFVDTVFWFKFKQRLPLGFHDVRFTFES